MSPSASVSFARMEVSATSGSSTTASNRSLTATGEAPDRTMRSSRRSTRRKFLRLAWLREERLREWLEKCIGIKLLLRKRAAPGCPRQKETRSGEIAGCVLTEAVDGGGPKLARSTRDDADAASRTRRWLAPKGFPAPRASSPLPASLGDERRTRHWRVGCGLCAGVCLIEADCCLRAAESTCEVAQRQPRGPAALRKSRRAYQLYEPLVALGRASPKRNVK